MTQLRSGPATTSGTPIKFREMLERSESRLAETGCYDGITDLALKAEDPLKYESLHTRLRSTVVSARETSKRISASPGIREVGECVVGLYTPEGDSVVFSFGIMVHVHTMSRFIKWMVRNDYQDDPGIRHGDIFAVGFNRSRLLHASTHDPLDRRGHQRGQSP